MDEISLTRTREVSEDLLACPEIPCGEGVTVSVRDVKRKNLFFAMDERFLERLVMRDLPDLTSKLSAAC